jgi:hypothetical protein
MSVEPTEESPPSTAVNEDWRRPDSLLQFMQYYQPLNGAKVADLFAGNGYYTARLLDANANVIAIVHSIEQQAALADLKQKRDLGDERLTIRMATDGEIGLGMAEVDMALCVDHYLTIPDRKDYFTRLHGCLRPPSRVFIVDYLMGALPVGPPEDQRVGETAVMDELDMYTDVLSRSNILPYQFILVAQDFVPVQ